MLRRSYIAAVLLSFFLVGSGVAKDDGAVVYTGDASAWSQFVSPVHYPITLAGNFGEPRPNHFHGGIDIKTDREEGKLIHAIGDGYVSRVCVGMNGFGNVVYVSHPNGYTSIYAHLKGFSSKIASLVRRYQYQHQTYICDVELGAADMPVSKGQFIAFSGNTGASFGPHLHLEILDAKGNKVDPLEYLKSQVTDTTAPEILSFRAYPQAGQGIFESKAAPSTHGFDREFTAWGAVGFSLRANDHMEGEYNNYGIYDMQMYVDDQLTFHSVMSYFPVSGNPMVNLWGDYDEYRRTGIWFMKTFMEPDLNLPMLYAPADRGIIHFREERPYRVKFVTSDIFGNTSERSFVVNARRTEFPPVNQVTENKETRQDKPVPEDNEGPIISPQSLTPSALSLRITDRMSAVKNYQAWLDGKFILFENPQNNWSIVCNLADTPVKPTGKPRTLRVVAVDKRDNTSEWTETITY